MGTEFKTGQHLNLAVGESLRLVNRQRMETYKNKKEDIAEKEKRGSAPQCCCN